MMHIMPWERNDTKDRMVTSAAMLLRERGVAGTSFAKVLEHSSTPRGSIGHHFPGGKREMVADAVRFAGAAAGGAMRHAAQRGDTPAELFAMVCGFYRRALVDSDFAAGCPVGNVAQVAHGDEPLRAATGEVFDDWPHRSRATTAAHHPHPAPHQGARMSTTQITIPPTPTRSRPSRSTTTAGSPATSATTSFPASPTPARTSCAPSASRPPR
jgi:AcrR family transcriptional regulator